MFPLHLSPIGHKVQIGPYFFVSKNEVNSPERRMFDTLVISLIAESCKKYYPGLAVLAGINPCDHKECLFLFGQKYAEYFQKKYKVNVPSYTGKISELWYNMVKTKHAYGLPNTFRYLSDIPGANESVDNRLGLLLFCFPENDSGSIDYVSKGLESNIALYYRYGISFPMHTLDINKLREVATRTDQAGNVPELVNMLFTNYKDEILDIIRPIIIKRIKEGYTFSTSDALMLIVSLPKLQATFDDNIIKKLYKIAHEDIELLMSYTDKYTDLFDESEVIKACLKNSQETIQLSEKVSRFIDRTRPILDDEDHEKLISLVSNSPKFAYYFSKNVSGRFQPAETILDRFCNYWSLRYYLDVIPHIPDTLEKVTLMIRVPDYPKELVLLAKKCRTRVPKFEPVIFKNNIARKKYIKSFGRSGAVKKESGMPKIWLTNNDDIGKVPVF